MKFTEKDIEEMRSMTVSTGIESQKLFEYLDEYLPKEIKEKLPDSSTLATFLNHVISWHLTRLKEHEEKWLEPERKPEDKSTFLEALEEIR